MGVINVTPDSFSDGGQFLDPDAAIAHGIELASPSWAADVFAGLLRAVGSVVGEP